MADRPTDRQHKAERPGEGGADFDRIKADVERRGEPEDEADGEALEELRAALVADGADPDPELGELVERLEREDADGPMVDDELDAG